MSEEKTYEELKAELKLIKKQNLEREIAIEKAKLEEAEKLKKQEAEEKIRNEIREEEKAKILEEMADENTTVTTETKDPNTTDLLQMDYRGKTEELVQLANNLVNYDLDSRGKKDKVTGLDYQALAKAVKTKAILSNRGF